MKEIRNLLLDCRAALRRADAKFESTALSDTLDDAIIRIGRENEPPPPSEVPVAKPHGHRIAYAWQAAARELRGSHPEVHEMLSARVFERLDEEVIDDAAHEIETLRERLLERQAACARLEGEVAAARVQLDALARTPCVPLAVAVAEQLEDPHVPSRALLQSVAAGKAQLSVDHRDWCIAEAMVLTGFERTPVQLMEQGEAALAALVLGGKATTA